MLILNITTEKNAELMDAPCKALGILQRKMIGGVDLQSFFRINNFSAYSMVSVDMSALKDNVMEELKTAVYSMQMLFPQVRLIFVALEGTRDIPALNMLVELGVTNIALSQSDIVVCMSMEGMRKPPNISALEPVPEAERPAETPPVRKEEQKTEINSPPETVEAPISFVQRQPRELSKEEVKTVEPEPLPAHIIKGKRHIIRPANKTKRTTTIGLCGLIRRAGTTTHAFGITGYLTEHGIPACYVEANGNGHIAWLSRYYEMTVDAQDAMLCSGVATVGDGSRVPQGMDFVIYDFGLLEEAPQREFFDCDIKIVCTGAKPWELSGIGEMFHTQHANTLVRLNYMYSFVDDDEREYVLGIMGQFAGKTYFSAYTPSLFAWQENEESYNAILRPHLKVG